MANSLQPLFEPVQLTNAAALYYTAVAKTRIDKMTVANPSATVSYTFTAYWVAAAGTPVTANILQPARAILPHEAYDVFPFIGQTLGVGDMIYAVASTGAVLNFFASGLVMST